MSIQTSRQTATQWVMERLVPALQSLGAQVYIVTLVVLGALQRDEDTDEIAVALRRRCIRWIAVPVAITVLLALILPNTIREVLYVPGTLLAVSLTFLVIREIASHAADLPRLVNAQRRPVRSALIGTFVAAWVLGLIVVMHVTASGAALGLVLPLIVLACLYCIPAYRECGRRFKAWRADRKQKRAAKKAGRRAEDRAAESDLIEESAEEIEILEGFEDLSPEYLARILRETEEDETEGSIVEVSDSSDSTGEDTSREDEHDEPSTESTRERQG